MPVPKHIESAEDLRTSASDTKAGFLQQAKKKVERAEPYVDAVELLRKELSKYASPDQLFEKAPDSVINEVIAASGYSDKACKYFSKQELRDAARAIVSKTHYQWPERWKERIVSKYLLTRGDSLGGEMRNWVGAEASRQLCQKIKLALENRSMAIEVVADTKSGKIRSIKWKNRRLLFDKKSPLVAKNIDVILLDEKCGNAGTEKERESELLTDPKAYIACGELKGGIDKAGADEHYKTAGTATSRIKREVPKVKTFFVGRAIERAMAKEIYEALQAGELDNAANLTKTQQVDALAAWLVSL